MHGRNSYDNQGAAIESRIVNDNNAYWTGAWFEFGIGDNINYRPLASLDIVAHEYTHAILQYSTNLGNTYELGALGESFGDIFGAIVEFYYEGNNGNYYSGDKYVIGGKGMARDMTNPNNTNHPNTYKGNYWIHSNNCNNPDPDYNDNCGVHTNCGVQNYWFYLLAEGGSGINNNGYSYLIHGIGRDKAAKIVYRSIANGYIVYNSRYIDAAISSVRVATELYGNCSYEAMQTYKAWQAVGVNFSSSSIPGYEYDAPTTCGFTTLMLSFPIFPSVHVSAMNRLDANCNISSANKPVTFSSGNEIRLLPGFTSNKDFHAYICDQTGPYSVSSTQKSFEENTIFYINNEIDKTNELQNKNDVITIYPNPNTGSFTIQSNNLDDIQQIQVINPLGQIVYTVQNPDRNTIDLSLGIKGTFFVRITTLTETVTRKILVE